MIQVFIGPNNRLMGNSSKNVKSSTGNSLDETRFCIFIPSYNAEKFIFNTVKRIPWDNLPDNIAFSVLFIDNKSTDGTWMEIDKACKALSDNHVQIYAIQNERNLGYGGSVKKAFDFCLNNNIGLLGILHADGQYYPEELPRLIHELQVHGDCALVYGSRLLGDPLKGGMPRYKYIANIILTWIQNLVLHSNYSEFHSGYRLYRMDIIKNIPYQGNSDYFDFDNHIIFQIHHYGFDIFETYIPTHYGNEKSYVSPIRTPLAILLNVMVYSLHKSGIIKTKSYSKNRK